jgi:hypothetical protein
VEVLWLLVYADQTRFDVSSVVDGLCENVNVPMVLIMEAALPMRQEEETSSSSRSSVGVVYLACIVPPPCPQ